MTRSCFRPLAAADAPSKRAALAKGKPLAAGQVAALWRTGVRSAPA